MAIVKTLTTALQDVSNFATGRQVCIRGASLDFVCEIITAPSTTSLEPFVLARMSGSNRIQAFDTDASVAIGYRVVTGSAPAGALWLQGVETSTEAAAVALSTGFQDISALPSGRQVYLVASPGTTVDIEVAESTSDSSGLFLTTLTTSMSPSSSPQASQLLLSDSSVAMRYVLRETPGPGALVNVWVSAGDAGSGGAGGGDRTTQLTWFIDPVNGSDSNTGLTADAALKTLTAWFLYSCNNGEFTFATPGVVVTILGDLAATDAPRGQVNVASQGDAVILTFKGAPRVVYTSTGAGVTVVALDAATNVPWQVTDPAIVWTTYIPSYTIPYRVRPTAAANARTYAWAVHDQGSHVGRWSSPMTADPALTAFGQSLETASIVNGMHFTIEQLPLVPDFGLSFFVQATNGPEGVIFQDLFFASPTHEYISTGPLANDTGVGTQMSFYGCSFGATIFTGGALVNCHTADGMIVRSGFLLGGAGGGNTAVEGFANQTIVSFQYMVQSDTDALGNGAFTVFSPLCLIESIQLYDSDIGLHVYSGSATLKPVFTSAKQIFGTSAFGTSYYRTEPDAFIFYDDKTGLTGVCGGGTGSAVSIGAPAVVTSIAALPVATNTSGMFSSTDEGPLFSKQLTMLPETAPGATAGEFKIYMDLADNKLKVIGPSGTVTTLGLP